MDEESRVFLIKIAQTISLIILWLLVNMTLGIFNNYAFFTTSISWKNIAFYVFFIASGFFVYKHLRKKWGN